MNGSFLQLGTVKFFRGKRNAYCFYFVFPVLLRLKFLQSFHQNGVAVTIL